MIIILHGQDSYRSRQKLNEIIEKFKEKNPDNLNLHFFQETSTFSDLKNIIEAGTIFDDKKLIVLNNFLQNSAETPKFHDLINNSNLKNDKNNILIFWENESLKKSDLKKYDPKEILIQEFVPLKGAQIANWIEKEVVKRGGKISRNLAGKLSSMYGNDLWRISNELDKFLASVTNGQLSEEIIDKLASADLNPNIFEAIDALFSGNNKHALKIFNEHIEKGENVNYLISMINYGIRNIFIVKKLADSGTPRSLITQKSKLHPFVVQKTFSLIQKFTFNQIKKIYQRLSLVDFQIKTGFLKPEIALDLFLSSFNQTLSAIS